MKQDVVGRLTAKSKEQQLLHILQTEFRQPPRVARAILQDVSECLQGNSAQVKPGQMRVMLVAMQARHGEALRNTLQQEVVWTSNSKFEMDFIRRATKGAKNEGYGRG